MQTILVATDFKPSALDCIPVVCDRFKDTDLNFIFIHIFKLSDSITDMLMLSRRSREYEQVNDEFYQRARDMKEQYPQVKIVKVDFFYGSTLNMFRNYLEANEVDYILDPVHCSVSKINKSSLDPAILVKRAGIPVLVIEKIAEKLMNEDRPQKIQVGELLTEA